MWCEKCQADVAAMASQDNERLYCTACGVELPRYSKPVPVSEAPTSATASLPRHDARELLARWAREDALAALDLSPRIAREPAAESRPQLRFDGLHAGPAPQPPVIERIAQQQPASIASPSPAVAEKSTREAVTRELVIHPPQPLAAPHFQSAPVPLADKATTWVTLVGQILSYVGVGALTVGSVLVLMGYFGGPPRYATTGWLVTTAGQMLLFLGVITLVSGGMEQTTQEVARRIDTLGDRLVRIEQASRGETATTRSED